MFRDNSIKITDEEREEYNQKLYSFFQKELPPKYWKILQEIDSVYILGGSVSSQLGNPILDKVNDYDIFYHYKDRKEVFDIIGLEFPTETFVYSPKTSHIKIVNDSLKIDLVEYTNDFDPENDVDFYCRMARFNGKKLLASDKTINDIKHKRLTYNYKHAAGYNFYLYQCMIDHYKKKGIQVTPYIFKLIVNPMDKHLNKLLENIQKLHSKGYDF